MILVQLLQKRPGLKIRELKHQKTQLIPLQQHNSVKSFFLLFLLLKRARQIFSWVSFTSMFFTTEGWFSGCNLVSQSINLGLGVWLIQTVNQSSQALFSYIGPYHCYLQSLCIKHWINTSMKIVYFYVLVQKRLGIQITFNGALLKGWFLWYLI